MPVKPLSTRVTDAFAEQHTNDFGQKYLEPAVVVSLAFVGFNVVRSAVLTYDALEQF